MNSGQRVELSPPRPKAVDLPSDPARAVWLAVAELTQNALAYAVAYRVAKAAGKHAWG